MSDLRTSIGAFFTLVGLIVTASGVLGTARAPLDVANVNVYSGAAMLLFGCVMLWLSRRSS